MRAAFLRLTGSLRSAASLVGGGGKGNNIAQPLGRCRLFLVHSPVCSSHWEFQGALQVLLQGSLHLQTLDNYYCDPLLSCNCKTRGGSRLQCFSVWRQEGPAWASAGLLATLQLQTGVQKSPSLPGSSSIVIVSLPSSSLLLLKGAEAGVIRLVDLTHQFESPCTTAVVCTTQSNPAPG